jgi:hypothetical protein
MKTLLGTGLLAAVVLLLPGSVLAETIHEIDYATYDATLTDSKGVKTDVTDLGFWTGPNILVAYRGDARVRIPFRRLRSLEIGKYDPVKGFSPATVTTRSGKSYKLQIERFDAQRYLSAKSEFGSLRIRLMRVTRLELKRLSHTEPDFNG